MRRSVVREALPELERLGIPIMLTWNGADRLPADHALNFGRPNTWGQRHSNILIQQSDLVIALGTRLGLQQTGFAWQEFIPNGSLIQVDIDEAELLKQNPRKDLSILQDANSFLVDILKSSESQDNWSRWRDFCGEVSREVPLAQHENTTRPGFVSPQKFLSEIAQFAPSDANLIPCSSGGTFTVAMQVLRNTTDQKILSNKGMASMGYGLSGAIGAALSRPQSMTLLFEGDGGFAQNLQELGTMVAQNLNLKAFVFANTGYASIRMTQKNYFDGAWIGCDQKTGLGLPDLAHLATTYGLRYTKISTQNDLQTKQLTEIFLRNEPELIEVPVDPEQTYFPKISSKLNDDGTMQSNPLHLMDPALSHEVASRVFRYINISGGEIE
jgi:acetolactate synthase-1/2/3 large subunit